ncbi:hypothetical protein [Cypionkella psychrotolerans]|uniref:hypothetical protein n=1 Tax=Cypionkella psychrotolerans TaxID=1678131 RepID=UPI0012E187F9|nr:hypothetical protein [Cypionkella psychrotolerans]
MRHSLFFRQLQAAICGGMIAAAPLPLAAQTPATDWQAALDSGSPRLMLFALQIEKPQGADDFVARLQYGQAMQQTKAAPPVMLSYRANLRPIVAYDGNINSGAPGDGYYIGDILFHNEDPDARAKAGMVFGGEASLTVRFAIAPGRTLDLTAYGTQAHSFDYGLDVLNAGLSACGAQYLGRTSWAEICLGDTFSQRDNAPERERFASIGISKVFASRFGFHEARATVQTSQRKDYDKTSLSLQLITAKAGLGALTLRIDASERIPGYNTRLFGTSAALTRPIAGVSTTLFAGYGVEAGGAIFGQPRRDEVFSIGLSRKLTSHAEASLRLSQRQSTIPAYDGVSVDLDVALIDF